MHSSVYVLNVVGMVLESITIAGALRRNMQIFECSLGICLLNFIRFPISGLQIVYLIVSMCSLLVKVH
jgi:hypothetical protein